MNPIKLDPREEQLLAEIQTSTGRTFRRLGGIDTNDQAVAKDVLPIIRKWIIHLDQPNYRTAIYALFACPEGKNHIEDVLRWVEEEHDAVALSVLKVVLLRTVAASTALPAWQSVRRRLTVYDDYDLIIKFTRFRATRAEALNVLYAFLESIEEIINNGERVRGFALGVLRGLRTLKDDSIQMWFQQQGDGPDPDLRRLAEHPPGPKRADPRTARAKQVSYRDLIELYSTSSDADQIKAVLDELELKFGVMIPAELKTAEALDSLPEEGICIGVDRSEEGPQRMLWLRFEDATTIAFRLLEKRGPQ